MKETVKVCTKTVFVPPTHVIVNGYHGVFFMGVSVGYILQSSHVVNSV